MKFLRPLATRSRDLDERFVLLMERHNLPIGLFHRRSPLWSPAYTFLMLAVFTILLAPALLAVTVGTELSYEIMVVYTGMVIVAFFVTLLYAIVGGIYKHLTKQRLIARYLAEHPERKY